MAHVVAHALDQMYQSVVLHLHPVLAANGHQLIRHALFRRLVESEFVAVIGKRPHFRVLAVVRDADDRDFRLFDEVQQDG